MTIVYPLESLSAHPPSLAPDYVATRKRAPLKPLVLLPHTLSELTGPVYGHESVAEDDGDLTRQHAGEPLGERIIVSGRVIDEDGRPVPNALIEIWQADAAGRYMTGERGRNSVFTGFGRAESDESGSYRFATVKPGPVAGPGGVLQAPHVNVGVFARGLLKRLLTRIYFSDEAGNAEDPVLSVVPKGRRSTLMARLSNENGNSIYAFDIRLQGENETVFFEG